MNRKKTKFIFLALLFFAFFGTAEISSAADHYVREGASGANNGSDWANAWTTLPATLTRGDTYYIADGNYSGYKINDAVSGNLVITIKKATIGDHGTGTGWDDSYGDGQAVWQSAGGLSAVMDIATSYVTFDGTTGSGSDISSYGFKFLGPQACDAFSYLIGAPGIGHSSMTINNITIRHVAMDNCGEGTGVNTQIGIYSFPASGSSMLIEHCYLADSSSNISIRNWEDGIIRDNYFAGNWSNTTYNHGQQISPGNSDNVLLYDNSFFNSTIFVVGSHNENGAGCAGWKVYNNLVVGGTDMAAIWAMAESGESDGMMNWEIHHNTHINVNCGGRGAVFAGTLTDVDTMKSYVYNNLFYNCVSPRMDNPEKTAGAVLHANNAYFSCTGIFDNSEGGTAQIGTGDPFVDSANGDYRLKEHTLAGADLGSPFNIDFVGNARSFWDRGAYEFVGSVPSDATAPAAPSGLTVD